MGPHTYGHPRFALVTGGSRGIGAACAMKLASVCDKVAITYWNSEHAAQEVAEHIRKAGAEPYLLLADLANPHAWSATLEQFLEERGPIDFVVNCAGVSIDNLCLNATLDELETTFRVNVFSSWVTMIRAAHHMIAQERGRIVNISSIAAHENSPGKSIYGASKAAVSALTRSAAHELGRLGVRINAVAPGFIETGLIANMPDKKRESYIKEIPQRRFGQPDEIAGVVCFLATDQADYIHGAILEVDGGMST